MKSAASLEFVVPGPPVPKERARVTIMRTGRMSGKTKAYTPGKTAAYENVVAMHALQARCKKREWPWQDKAAKFAVTITIERSSGKGDWDNFAKAITDACNGVLWPDDRQIVFASVEIHEGMKGLEMAKIHVEAWIGGNDNDEVPSKK